MQDHRVLPKLRHHRWKGWSEGDVAGRPLLKMPLKGIPHVGIGEDTAERYEFVSTAMIAGGPRSLEEWEAIGVKNLAKRSMEWKVVKTTRGLLGMGKKPVSLQLVEEFACERILDPHTMQRAHELLKAELLMVAIPVRGILWACPAGDVEETGAFMATTRAAFVGAPRTMEPISPLVFTVSSGALVGVVRGLGEEDVDVVPTAGFGLPMDEELETEDDEDDLEDEDARIHFVAYVPSTKSIHFAGYLGEDETLPASDVEKVRGWIARKTTEDGRPIDAVHVEFPDADSARRARPALAPLGVRVMAMNDRGELEELPAPR
jgi:hypothetical protein